MNHFCPACGSREVYVQPYATIYGWGDSDRWVCGRCWVSGELLHADDVLLFTVDKQLVPPTS